MPQVLPNNRSFRFCILSNPVGVKRSRDPVILDACDIVVDVGAVYDESKQRFDHHQRGFQETFGYGFTTKLSSAGLIYKCVEGLPSCGNHMAESLEQAFWKRNHYCSNWCRS